MVTAQTLGYLDRSDAGRDLAGKLTYYANRPGVIVLALPRGGVPVAYEIATRLRAPLDVYTVRKLGVPGHEELAMGAVASDGSYVVDPGIVEQLGIPEQLFKSILQRELVEIRRRERAYRDDLPRPNLYDKIVIIVDDGLATGSTMYAAVEALRRQSPDRIVVAVPVGSANSCAMLQDIADDVVCVHAPVHFRAVSLYYQNFPQVSDDEVRDLLDRAAKESKKWNAA